MSIAKPQTRDEMRQYILTKLGAPVLEVNVAQEQLDIAIDDAFQFFNERSHFLGTERMYLTMRMTQEFQVAFSSFRLQETSQEGKNAPQVPIPGRPTLNGEGLVDELTLVTPGQGYPSNARPLVNQLTSEETDIGITTMDGDDISTNPDADNIVYETNATDASTGKNLTVNIGSQRTTKGGITTVTIYNPGYGYKVGDIVSVNGGTVEPALFEVTKVVTTAPVYETAPIQTQNNYLVMPDDVVAVNGILRSLSTDLVGIFPGGAVFPLMLGGNY